MLVLGIESSCDDTAAAVVRDGYEIVASRVSSQDEFHRRFGGVVPEIASRKHLEVIDLVCRDCLDTAGLTLEQIDGIAVTRGPGLMGSLLVGLNFAKALAFAAGKPFFCVDHLEAHLAAPFLGVAEPVFPLVGLVVSGGHTNLYLMHDFFNAELLGRTVDDAAGEAFDKVAKYLGLEYPGGRVIDDLAKTGDPKAFDFPRPMIHSGDFHFSFSGLKTAVIGKIKELGDIDAATLRDLVASFQEAVVDLLVTKLEVAVKTLDMRRVALSGGVAANSRLRQAIREKAEENGWEVFFSALEHCTDNAAMVAAAGFHHLARGERSELEADSYAGSQIVRRGRLTEGEKRRIIPQNPKSKG